MSTNLVLWEVVVGGRDEGGGEECVMVRTVLAAAVEWTRGVGGGGAGDAVATSMHSSWCSS